MVVHRLSTGERGALFWLISESVLVDWNIDCLNWSFECCLEVTIDCHRACAAYDVRMGLFRGALLALFCALAGCGGTKEANGPPVDQTAQPDASVSQPATDAASNADVPIMQTDAAALAVAEAGPPDDVDKSISVCGDEAIPIEKRVRKKVKECWSAAATRDPSLDGHVRVTFVIDSHGKITKTDIAQKKTLGADTSACITAAIGAYKLDGTKCAGKTVGFEMAFGRAARD
jgi:hypothetical protein